MTSRIKEIQQQFFQSGPPVLVLAPRGFARYNLPPMVGNIELDGEGCEEGLDFSWAMLFVWHMVIWVWGVSLS